MNVASRNTPGVRMARRTITNTRSQSLLLAASLTGILVAVFGAGTAEARIWKDASGKHTIDAEFVELTDGVVKLRKPDGKVQSLSLKKLSKADQDHVASLTKPPAKDDTETIRLQLVIAEGVGRKKGDAVKNALRSAVRQSLANLVAAKDLVEHDEKIEDKLFSDTSGFIEKHKTLDESREGGIVHVKVKARVIQSDVVAELKAAGVPLLSKEIQHRYSIVAQLDPNDDSELKDSLKENAWAIRTADYRANAVKINGGSGESEQAVKAGLGWLARHQNRNGSWSFNHTQKGRCSGFPNPGTVTSKMGATGMALLAFLGDGHTHKQKSKYQKTVRSGIAFLVSNMAKTGRMYEPGGPNQMHLYSHGIAACAVIEAYGMTKDKKLKKASLAALNYIAKAQGYDGGWRYVPKYPGDTSVTGWQVMALKSAKMAKLDLPKKMVPSVMEFLDAVQQENGEYVYMSRSPLEDSSATTAIALLCRTYLGWPKDHSGLKNGVAYVGRKGPHPINMYFNYYATMFMFQNDGPSGPAWKQWNGTMQQHLMQSQARDNEPHLEGSWHFSSKSKVDGAIEGGRL